MVEEKKKVPREPLIGAFGETTGLALGECTLGAITVCQAQLGPDLLVHDLSYCRFVPLAATGVA